MNMSIGLRNLHFHFFLTLVFAFSKKFVHFFDPYFTQQNMSERRPNPEGWVPPRAPYNPYDSTDTRPPQGYPSEFNTPGKQRSWTVRPKEPENYRIVKDQLKRLQYTPRPLSDIYPGQYKVLRRSDTGAFTKGIRITSLLLSSGKLVD